MDNNTIDINVAISDKIESPSIIKVLGVGGGGGNAVNNMFRVGITDVSFAVCNTDWMALQASPVPHKIKIGDLGAGGIPEVAEAAALNNENRIREALDDGTKMLFLTATMGGGTGTGASPVVARIAQELGILTVGIVTIPFEFEGPQKIKQAIKGLIALSEHVDALLVINNEKLYSLYPKLPISEAFKKADDVLANAAKSIAEIITKVGYIQVDFADVYSTLKDGNVAIMNVGMASGEHRITAAIDDALNSPLVSSTDIHGAKKILFNLYCSRSNEIRPEEIHEIHDFMKEMGDDVNVIWGINFEDELEDNVKVTLIATGYEMTSIPGIPVNTVTRKTKKPAYYPTPAAEEHGVEVEDLVEEADDEQEAPETRIDDAIKAHYEQGGTTSTVRRQSHEDVDLTQQFSQTEIENIPAWKRKRMNK